MGQKNRKCKGLEVSGTSEKAFVEGLWMWVMGVAEIRDQKHQPDQNMRNPSWHDGDFAYFLSVAESQWWDRHRGE